MPAKVSQYYKNQCYTNKNLYRTRPYRTLCRGPRTQAFVEEMVSPMELYDVYGGVLKWMIIGDSWGFMDDSW